MSVSHAQALLKVYSQPQERTSPLFCRAFAEGCGGSVYTGSYTGGDWAGFGSPNNWFSVQDALARKQEVYYGDHGFFKRGVYYRIAKNSICHTGLGHSDKKRISALNIQIKPWIKHGRYIIICPQSDGFFQLRHNITQDAWVKNVIAEIRKYTDRPYKVHQKKDIRPLVDILPNAYCVISHSSNSGLEAILAGVPAITLAPCHVSCMSRNSIADINNLIYPENRHSWAAVLADNQWTLDEIKCGMAWRKLNEEV